MLTMKKHLTIVLAIVALGLPGAQAQERSLIVRLNPAIEDILPPDAKVEKLVSNFGFLEGPVWVRKGGYLLFSDIPANVINKWSPDDGKVSIFLAYSGFTGTDDSGAGMQLNNGFATVTLLGSNAVTLDPHGRVVYCAHGDRQVVRLEEDGRRTVLASQYEGKRLNSPNDLVYKSDGSLYFTDPAAGLRNGNDDPKKELPFTGVYLLKDGKLQLLTKDFRPNGLAFTPDEKHLYLINSDKKSILRYDVQPDDTITNAQAFIDMSLDKAPGGPDGMKVDQKGNVYCTGPGGFWIMSAEGKHLATVLTPEVVANLAFGGADGKTLFLMGRTSLYQIHLKVPGILP
jgi:gluconolactonase